MKMSKKVPFLCVMTGIVLAVIVALTEDDGKEYITGINRPAIGKGHADYRLNVSYDGIEGTIDIALGERGINFAEAQEIFKRGEEEIIRILEEENGPLDEVTYDLYLPESVLGEGLELIWRSGNRQYILDDGTLDRDACLEITDVGQVVIMTATMSVQDYKAELEIPIRITEKVFSEEEKKINLVHRKIEEAAENYAQADNVELPDVIEGKEAKYYRFRERGWWKCLLLGVMAAFAYILWERQKITKEKENRDKELQLAYAPIITKFSLLVGAGITIRGAWEKLVSDYEKNSEKNAAYEEMLKVCNEMKNGLSEGQAYVTFGRRCKLSSYVKFGNLLEQNLRKGTKGLTERLEREVWEAFEERKALACRLGEEAGTKLLFPMILSLGIVIALCVVPAFLNM